jgi:hypothetical protein
MTVHIKEYDYNPRNLPKEILESIGLAIASAAQTESVISMAIGGCLGLEIEYFLAVTTHMSLPLKFSVLRAAAEIRIDNLDDLDELDRLLDEVDKAIAKRHEIAHCEWCCDPDTKQLFRVKKVARTSVNAEMLPVTPESVKAEAEIIFQAGLNLMTFIMARDMLPKIPAAKRPRFHKTKAERKKRRQK